MNILQSSLICLTAVFVASPWCVAEELPPAIEYIPLEEVELNDVVVDERPDPPQQDDRIDDSIDGGNDLVPRDEQPAIPEDGWDLGLALEVAYDDNIFLSANRPQSDLVLRITPRIAYQFGTPDDQGCYVRFLYRPSGVIYFENSDETRLDQDFALEAGVVGKRSELRVGTLLRRLGDATPDTGTQTERSEYEAEARYTWRPREKIRLEAAIGIEGEDYDQANFADSERSYGEIAVRYAYSPKTEFGAAWRFGSERIDFAGTQDVNRATARMIWRPREKWSIDVEAGFEHRDYTSGSDTYPVLEARLDWQMKEGTGFYLGAYRREESSAFFPGQNIELTGINAGVSQRLGSRWTGRLEAGYEQGDYKRVSGTGPARRKDKIFYIQPSLDYQLSEQLRFGVFYRYARNDSSGPAFGYKQNQVGVDMTYDF